MITDEIIAFLNRNYEKPLNVQIEEMKDYLGGYTLEASDVVYIETHNAAYTATSSDRTVVIPVTLTLNTSGTIRISCGIRGTGSSSNGRNGRLEVYINGTKSDEIYSSGVGSFVTASKDFAVNKGDVITFKLQSYNGYSGYLQADSLNICATAVPVSQGNLIELIGG